MSSSVPPPGGPDPEHAQTPEPSERHTEPASSGRPGQARARSRSTRVLVAAAGAVVLVIGIAITVVVLHVDGVTTGHAHGVAAPASGTASPGTHLDAPGSAVGSVAGGQPSPLALQLRALLVYNSRRPDDFASLACAPITDAARQLMREQTAALPPSAYYYAHDDPVVSGTTGILHLALMRDGSVTTIDLPITHTAGGNWCIHNG